MAANIQPIRLARCFGRWNSDSFTQHFTEGAGPQTYKEGAPLIFSGAELIVAPSASGLVGIANVKASGVETTDVPVTMFMPYLVFAISVDKVLVGGNAPGTGKPSDFTIGSTYGISVDAASGNWYLSLTAGTLAAASVLIGYDTDQTSVINGRAYIHVLQSVTAWT